MIEIQAAKCGEWTHTHTQNEEKKGILYDIFYFSITRKWGNKITKMKTKELGDK